MEESRIALPIGATLDRFIQKKQDEFQYATGELSQLLRDIALAGKVVNREINKAGLIDIVGPVGTENIQGEEQQKLDVLANIKTESLRWSVQPDVNASALITTPDDDDFKYVVMPMRI